MSSALSGALQGMYCLLALSRACMHLLLFVYILFQEFKHCSSRYMPNPGSCSLEHASHRAEELHIEATEIGEAIPFLAPSPCSHDWPHRCHKAHCEKCSLFSVLKKLAFGVPTVVAALFFLATPTGSMSCL